MMHRLLPKIKVFKPSNAWGIELKDAASAAVDEGIGAGHMLDSR